MSNAAHAHDLDHHHPSFVNRWLFSTNHKDIGTLYIIFSLVAAVVGVGLSLVMRVGRRILTGHVSNVVNVQIRPGRTGCPSSR